MPPPDVPRRRADRRGVLGAQRRRQGRRVEPRDRAARPRRHPEREVTRARLPAPVLGRHAPARDDRDGARPQPGHPHLRRADDRARRDGAGADPRADRGRQARVRHRRHPRHARPRRRRGDRQLGDGDVRGTRDGVRAGGRDLPSAAASVRLGAARLDADDRAPPRRARADRRLSAVAPRAARPAARSIRAARTGSSRARPSGRRSRSRPRARISTPAICRTRRRSSSASSARRRWPRERDGRQPRRARAPDEALRREAGRVRARHGEGARGRRRHAAGAPRRDARDRRRVRLRQVDDRAADAAAARRDERHGSLRRPRHLAPCRSGRCVRFAARCRWCSRTRTRP